MVALAGVHAARAADMLALRLDDVDLGSRRIIIAGRARLLDDLTHRLLLDWLCHRAARWPDTANPHLLVNHITATTTAPASGQSASLILHRQAATLERLRIDRILEEALACGGDLLHLASVFGLDTKTAIRYADSARELLTTTAEEQDPAHSGLKPSMVREDLSVQPEAPSVRMNSGGIQGDRPSKRQRRNPHHRAGSSCRPARLHPGHAPSHPDFLPRVSGSIPSPVTVDDPPI